MDILSRYLGAEQNPRLSKLGGKDFEHIKQKVRESIRKMSFDLRKLYEERNALSGFAFKNDIELQNIFVGNFPFEDTIDQTIASKEIEEDMTSNKVMDRLICGDVGFGKTEVAFRAAFRAIVNGKQVAMLAPTTILSEQHYNTALERFKGFGVNIAVLNRFRTPKQQAEIIEKVKQGKIDFVIGTHKLLKEGAALVTNSDDIINYLNWEVDNTHTCDTNNNSDDLSQDEKNVIEIIAYEPVNVEKIASKTNININDLMIILTMLELKGIIKQLPGEIYMKA